MKKVWKFSILVLDIRSLAKFANSFRFLATMNNIHRLEFQELKLIYLENYNYLEMHKRITSKSLRFIMGFMIIFTLSCEEDKPLNPDPNIFTPIASFDYTMQILENIVRVSFINTSQNADVYLWDFGDGTSSTQVSPVKDYPRPIAKPKSYNVVLTAFDTVNDTYNRTSTTLLLEP